MRKAEQKVVRISPLHMYHALEWLKSNKAEQLTVEVNTAASFCIAVSSKWGSARNPFLMTSSKQGQQQLAFSAVPSPWCAAVLGSQQSLSPRGMPLLGTRFISQAVCLT